MMNLHKMINKVPFTFDWVEFNGEHVVAQFNLEASIKSRRPMFDISHCMTKALNQIVECTVQYDKSKFKPSHLGKSKW